MKEMETAIILAGGKSSRMGFDKQFIRFQDRYLVELLAERLEKIFPEIIIVTGRPEAYSKDRYRIIEDRVKGFGPLAGIHAGLLKSESIHNYVIACDMPFIRRDYIEYMMDLISQKAGKVDGVITRLGEWIEPFNAFYSKNLIGRIEDSMEKGRRQINQMLKDSGVLYVSEAEARRFSPDWDMFTNINTFEDYEKLMEQLHKLREV